MASIDIFHLLNDLVLFVNVLVETKNFQTIGAEEGLQFSRAQLEERLQSSFCLGRWGFREGFGWAAGVVVATGVAVFFKASSLSGRL